MIYLNGQLAPHTHASVELHQATDEQEHTPRHNSYRVLAACVLLPANLVLAYATGIVYGCALISESIFPIDK